MAVGRRRRAGASERRAAVAEWSDRVSAPVGALGGIIALFVVVTEERPASALACGGVLTVAAVWFVARVTTARRSSGEFRWPGARRATIVASTATVLAAATAAALPASRTFLMYDVAGFHRDRLDIVHMLLSESDSTFRISVAVLNGSDEERVVRKIEVRSGCRFAAPPRQAPGLYGVDNELVRVGDSPGRITGKVHIEPDRQYWTGAHGTIRQDTCGRFITLAFGATTTLPANTVTTVIIDLPKRFMVTADKPPDPPASPTPSASTVGSTPDAGTAGTHHRREIEIDRPDRTEFSVRLDTGDRTASARLD